MPQDLDDLMHFVWQELDEGEDERLAEAIVNLHKAVDGNRFEAFDGEVSDLTDAEISFIGRKVDPSEATGMILSDWIDCTAHQLDRVVTYEKQDELYTGVYDSYDRTTTSDLAAYLDGESDRLTWDLHYTTSALGAGYAVDSTTAVRRISQLDPRDGPAMLIRAHLLDDAVFDNPDSKGFLDQDYHLEVYWPHDGGMLHAYALWKDTRLLGFEDEQEATQRITLNKLSQWDDGTSQLCQEGRP